jgi:predicted acetyltransferase
MTQGWELIGLTPDRAAELIEAEQWGWGDVRPPDDAEHLVEVLDWDRTCAAVTGAGKIVGFSASWHQDLPVPGGVLPAGGLTWVSVRPEYRRRGILRTMISEHFRRCLARGEVASSLYAAEVPIYTRFGYGQVDQIVRCTLPRGVKLWDVPGVDEVELSLEHASAQAHAELTADIYRQASAALGRTWVPPGQDGPWSARFRDPEIEREGAENLRVAIARRNGQPTGFAFFRRKDHWEPENVPNGTLIVHQMISADPASIRALWGLLTDMDLIGKVVVWAHPWDDPLFRLLQNPRLAKTMVGDALHLRLLDLPKALMARSYAADADLVLEVGDAQLPENAGRWHFQVRAGRASVERGDGPPALTLDTRILASVFLGGIPAASYADAGLIVEHTPGAVRALAQAVWVPRSPGTPFVF